MFVAGLAIGPAIGLLAADFLFRSRSFRGAWGALVLGLVCIAVLAAPVSNPGLRVGLVFGILLGALLVVTPDRVGPAASAE